MKIIIVIK